MTRQPKPKTAWETRFGTNSLKLSETEFTILRDLIHERIGSFYPNSKHDLLEDKLSPLIIERGFSSFLDYYYLLKYDTIESDTEWKQVTDALRVPETFFWREIEPIKALADVIVPQYFSTSRTEPLRIWSAACSTGEEPLTIAMVLNEAGWFERGVPIEIIASDISTSAVKKAQQGVYRNYSMRNLPDHLRSKYFREYLGTWQIVPELLLRVKWTNANLISKAQIAPLALSNIIFCRNVFIYFSEGKIRKVVQTFFDFMPSPGYLFVGSSESLLKLTTDFELDEIGGTFVYIKR